MKPAYEVITREIAAKGAGYLLLRRCPPQELGETLARGRAELLAAGAAELYAASADPACPLDEGRWEGFRLSHVRDMLWMERPLDQLPPAEGLTLEPLTRARGGAWLTLHNACFFDMPNSATSACGSWRRPWARNGAAALPWRTACRWGCTSWRWPGRCRRLRALPSTRISRGKDWAGRYSAPSWRSWRGWAVGAAACWWPRTMGGPSPSTAGRGSGRRQ